jgi:hypothetical protein
VRQDPFTEHLDDQKVVLAIAWLAQAEIVADFMLTTAQERDAARAFAFQDLAGEER